MKRPIGISIISYYYIYGAFILFITSIFYESHINEIGISDRFGLTHVPEQFMRLVVASITLIIIYGYMKLKKWGFWLMIVYSILFGTISLVLTLTYNQQPYIGNMIWSFIVLLYTLYTHKSFKHRKGCESKADSNYVIR
ncbi:hypothetical protein P9D39_13155 [Heyndrickxia oleronia]|uniref:Uncharacterized protein n=2 Tax=Heyndrickxia oleronia TaxID=38875 RepID=A0A8E2I910_9BACI|nr:hypothetical protein [Heyndrickxia oleronia]MEC1375248.1 hypothetical protein [Heyndrickxia oleronia]OOP65153.1 hypothetical protein BWZ43_25170 [Heyndrickxia oleronia]QQZ03020.1 hypothetical protein I5818_14745 [Heyndrickxia oleronia]